MLTISNGAGAVILPSQFSVTMSLLLSTTSLVGPIVPPWLEDTCQRLVDNDPTFLTVELTHPRVDDVFAKVVAKALRDNCVVTTLVLSCYAIVDDGAFAIGSVLGSNKSIEKLQLRDLRNVREISTFFELLVENRTFTEVSLRHCVICPRGARVIASFLKQHPKLQEFRLTDSQLCADALQILCDGVKGNVTLQSVYFVNDEINGSESAMHLSNMLNGSSIRELYLGENNLDDGGVEVLALGILRSNTALRHLDMRSNGITQAGALSLQGLIVNSRFLLSLNVSDNEFGNLGATAIARGLQNSQCKLRKLDMNANEIGVAGAKAVAIMLRFNKALEELNLSFNKLGDDGAAAIASALQHNSKLRLLSLRRNGISDAGAKHIADKMPRMQGLKELLLTKNHIGSAGRSELLEGLRSNMELEYLHVEEVVSEPLGREIVHWVRLNKAGRRIFCKTNSVPRPLWSHVYGRISSDSDAVSRP